MTSALRPLAHRAESAVDEDALRPVAQALVAEAERRADEIRSGAAEAVREMLDAAGAKSARILEQARAEGDAAARRAARAMLVEARREAGRLVLDARRQAYEGVRRAALAELARRAETPEGRALRDRLGAVARARLGPEAAVAVAEDGGVVAVLGERRVDLRNAALVDRALPSFGPSIAGLWP